MISWLEHIGPDPVLAALSASTYVNATNAFGVNYPVMGLRIFEQQNSGSSDCNSTVTAMSGKTIYRQTDFDGISYPPYTSSSSFETQTTTATSGITESVPYATLYKQTSTTFTTDQGEYWWMGKFSQLVTTTTSAQTTEWTTKTGSSSTWFTTSTKNITILTADNQDTTLTFETITTNGEIPIGTNGVIANTIVQASPNEVLYVVDGGNLKVCKLSELRLLTDVATTQTRITLSYSSPYYTAKPIYYHNQTFTAPEGQTGDSSETQTYSSLKYSWTFTTTTYTVHTGVIPTPTSTFLLRESYTTAQGTYTVSELYGGGGGGGGVGPTPQVAMQTTITYPVYGKIPGIKNFEGKLISFDQIVQVDIGTIQSQYYANDPLARDGTNFVSFTNSDDNNVYVSGGDGNIVVDKTESRIGLSVGYYEDNNVPNNPAISQGFVAYKSGVMTSPNSYFGRLSINNKTLLTGTTNATTSSVYWWNTISVTTTTTIRENPSTATTYKTTTTTFSPTYARFHRINGGAALMPTSGDAYTADLTAVTYTTTTVESSSSTTTSQTLSAAESGVTGLLAGAGGLIGGAAGFGDTIYANVFGLMKINGSKSFFSHNAFFSTTTASGSTLSASRIEFPALAFTSQNGGGYFVGGYSYTDILND